VSDGIFAKGRPLLTFLGVLKPKPMDDACGMRLRLPSRLGHACARSRLVTDESGIALILALAVILVLTVVLTTVIFTTASGARDSQHKNAQQKAYALAEAGVNDALAVLYQNYPGTTGFPGDPTLLPSRTTSYSTGSATWSGTLGAAPPGLAWGAQWTITSTGTVKNPTGPTASNVTRTIGAVVPVIIPIKAPVGNNNPLNFIYSWRDLTFSNSVKIEAPLYAQRDLHLNNSSTVSEYIGGNNPSTKNKLAVGRDLYEAQNADQVGHVWGTAGVNQLSEAHVVGQCSTRANNVTLHPCAWGNTDQIWADTADGTIPPNFLSYTPQLTCCAPFMDVGTLAPTEASGGWSNMGAAYIGANLGPTHPCTSGSKPFTFGSAQTSGNVFDNDATPAGSSPIDLTPAGVNYSCTSSSGGEISWDGTSKFRVQGTIFIDGSAAITSPQANAATVTGQGVIFLTGTFLMKNALMCVKTVGSGNGNNGAKCDTSAGAWDPNIGALIIVADGDGGYDSTQGQSNNITAGQGITIKGSYLQGGLIANKDINVDTTSEMQGPMISVYNNVTAGQTNDLSFPPLQFAPGGATDVGPTPVPTLLPPRQFAGG
jgi:hypothetical protein